MAKKLYEESNIQAIADAIRSKNGTTDTYKVSEMAGAIGAIEAGGGSGINPEWTDWGYFSYNNNRNDFVAKLKFSDTSKGTSFGSMFYGCSNLTTIPEIDTSKGTDFSSMFRECRKLTAIPQLDTSKGTNFRYMFNYCPITTIPKIDTSNGTGFNNMFYGCSNLTTIPEIGTSNGTSFGAMFGYCQVLTTIPQLDISKGTNFNNMFDFCTDLENITFVGTINASISFSYSTKLTHDSLMSIINALADKTGQSGTFKLTIGATNITKLTNEEIEIIGAKGWIYA